MTKKILFILLLPLLLIPCSVFAESLQNEKIDFKYDNQELNIAQFYTVSAGNHKMYISGNVNYTGTEELYRAYMYVNFNVCTDMDLISINTPSNIDNMYVYQSGQSCQFNASNYKGKVFNIYFRIIKPRNASSFYEGYFYLNSSNEHSIEFINSFANSEGFPMNSNQSYTADLEELKELLRNSNSGIKDSIDKNSEAVKKQTEEQKKTNDLIKDDTDVDTSKIDSLVGYLPVGPVDSIINLPLSMLNSINSNLSKNCSSLSINIPFINEKFTLPCINSLYDKMGATTLINSLGGILAAILLYKYLLNLYKYVDHVLSLQGDRLNSWGD